MTQVKPAALLVVVLVFAGQAFADPAVIEAAEAHQEGDRWLFDVTLSHGDTGWDDYADGWRVVAEDGSVLGTRELLHPHETEQPFTRSLSGVVIPEDVGTVFIEARTNTEGWGQERYPLDLVDR
jgi:hypothetical protein